MTTKLNIDSLDKKELSSFEGLYLKNNNYDILKLNIDSFD
jgi:hypothetical protein